MAANLDMATVEAYVEATDDVSLEALKLSVEQFASGKVERNNAYAPSSAELAQNARKWQEGINKRSTPPQQYITYPIGTKPPEGYISAGAYEEKQEEPEQPRGLALPTLRRF